MNNQPRLLHIFIPLGGAFVFLLAVFSFLATSGFAADDVVILAPTIDVGPDNQAKAAEPGDTITYTYWLTNGTTAETYTVSADNAGGWVTDISTDNVPLGNGASASVVLTLTVPSTETSGPVLTTITATAQESPPTPGSSTNSTIVAAHPDVAMSAQDDSLSGAPGATVTYTLLISNTGNANDNYSITAAGGSNAFPTTASQSLIEIDAYKSSQFEVYVQIPPGTAGNTVDTATITATSEVNGSLTAVEQLATTAANVSAVSFTPSQINKSGLPGQQLVYSHLVNNDGNFNDTYNITYSSAYQVQLSSTSLQVDKDESKPLTVTIGIPSGALSSTVNVTVVTATSSVDSQIYAVAQDLTTVLLAPGVSIVKDESGTADPGSFVEYVHTVTNLGNGRDNFKATALSDQGFTVQVTPGNFTLDGGAFRLVTVRVDIPVGAIGGAIDKTTVTVESKKDPGVKDQVVDTTTVNGYRLYIPLASKASEWTQVGATTWKSGDAATAVDVCSTNSDLIFAGTQEDLRLFDGSSWKTPSGSPKGYTIASIVLNSDCDTVYFVVFKSSSDPEVAAHGVWEGTLNGQNWTFQELAGGVDVTFARKAAVSGDTLFAGGAFGIAYWDQGQWIATNVRASASLPIMDISVADSINNEGPLYAVQWVNSGIISNMNPIGQPGQWSMIPGIAPLPDNLVRAVAGDDKNVQYVGTSSHHYKLVGGNWVEVNNQTTRALLAGAVDYVGYSGARDPNTGEITDPGDGVYRSTDDGATFTPINEGWKPPQDVLNLESNNNYVFAATSAGVFKR